MKHSKLSYLLKSNLLDLLKLAAARKVIYIYIYIYHKVAKDLDQGRARVSWPRCQAAVTAVGLIV